MNTGPVVYTVGHSTRSDTEFAELLRNYGIELLADVRTVPRSRHNPQFNKETLSSFLKTQGIEYRHMKELGGLRHPRPDSSNTGWRNASFRGYADYMQTPDFSQALENLIELASESLTAVMCAEAVPCRCHRSLIADALLVRGIDVIDILSLKSTKAHVLTPMAKVQGRLITYPGTG
jgi:uncharacterized protein (DUF488 family)